MSLKLGLLRNPKHAGLRRPFGPSSGATLLSILEVEIYFEYVEARVCQDGGCEGPRHPCLKSHVCQGHDKNVKRRMKVLRPPSHCTRYFTKV